MQDESGAIRAAIKFIYYLIWVRDGAIIAAPAAQAGWLDPLARWDAFLLANPTLTEHEPKGRFFGQLVNGRITKWARGRAVLRRVVRVHPLLPDRRAALRER